VKLGRIILIVTIILVIVMWVSSKVFDSMWASKCYKPLMDLEEVYRPPAEYDNIARVKLKMVDEHILGIMGNRKFTLVPNGNGMLGPESADYYHTTSVSYPNEVSGSLMNKIYLRFEGYNGPDSIHLVTTKSYRGGLKWNQIFFSSVAVAEINDFSPESSSWDANTDNLVDKKLLEDNDTLINLSIGYFNAGEDTMKMYDCGATARIFKSVCEKFALPCRIITLQNGKSGSTGLGDEVGYPVHAVCEVYSSRLKKWYVIDPSFGLRFRNSTDGKFLNAVEISNRTFFEDERSIVRDSILFTVRRPVEFAYFPYYNNVLYNFKEDQDKWMEKVLKYLFKNSDLNVIHYSNQLKASKDAIYYMSWKSIMYIVFGFIYISTLIFLITKRRIKDKN